MIFVNRCATYKPNPEDDVIKFIVFMLSDPSEIATHPVNQVVWVGEPVTLFCNATGNPAPKISYSAVGENGTVGNDETLVINSSSVAYVKTYTCTADNGVQPLAAVNATVMVLGKSSFCLTLQDLVTDMLLTSAKLEKICYQNYRGDLSNIKLTTQRTIGQGKCDEEIRIEIYVKFISTHKNNHLKKIVEKFISGLKTLYRLGCDEHSAECFKFY